MNQSNEAWTDVVEQVKKLGSAVKDHYQTQERDTETEALPEDEVRDALLAIGEIVKAAFATVGDAIKDPEIQEEAKQTAGSFFDALGTTFSELGDDISQGGGVQDSPEQPPAEGAAGSDTSAQED